MRSQRSGSVSCPLLPPNSLCQTAIGVIAGAMMIVVCGAVMVDIARPIVIVVSGAAVVVKISATAVVDGSGTLMIFVFKAATTDVSALVCVDDVCSFSGP